MKFKRLLTINNCIYYYCKDNWQSGIYLSEADRKKIIKYWEFLDITIKMGVTLFIVKTADINLLETFECCLNFEIQEGGRDGWM